jgi:hypothetical protein
MCSNSISSSMGEIYDAINTGNLDLLKKFFHSQKYVDQLSWKTWSDWVEGWKDYTIEELTPLAKAVELGNMEVVKLLLQAGRNLADFRFPLDEALCIACDAGHIELVKILLKAKADIGHIRGTVYMNDSSFFNCAICRGHIEIIQILVAFGFDVNGSGDEGMTPLVAAALKNNVAVAKYLVEVGADVNKPDDECGWETAIIKAGYFGHQEMLDYLEPLSLPEAIRIAKENFGKHAQASQM